MITVQTGGRLSEQSEHSEYSTEYFYESSAGPDFNLCNEETVSSALQSGHLTADQALWMHQNHMNWQIVVEQ
jgi:hypothetical protein